MSSRRAGAFGPPLLALALSCFSPTAHARQEPGATVVTQHETIPNPVHGSALRVAAGCTPATPCSWFAPATWVGGVVPGAESRAIVDGAVVIDATGALAREVGVYPGGRLSFATDVDTGLSTGSVVVFEDGALLERFAACG